MSGRTKIFLHFLEGPDWLLGLTSHILGVTWGNAAEGEADHSLPLIAEIKNERN